MFLFIFHIINLIGKAGKPLEVVIDTFIRRKGREQAKKRKKSSKKIKLISMLCMIIYFVGYLHIWYYSTLHMLTLDQG